MILGHRGIRQPENISLPYQNTMEAFEYAFEKGADGIELDVFASKDGKCFVIHDDDISMHGGKGSITQLNTKEIEKEKIHNGKYKIPKLKDAIELIKSKDKFLNIEIKQQGIVDIVLSEIKESRVDYKNLLVSSFDHHDLIKLRGLDDKIKIGLLFGRESRENPNYEQYIMGLSERLEPTAFCMEKTLSYLSVLESKNEKYFWTIKKEDMKNFLVDGLLMYENVHLFTDYPEELRKYLKK